MLVQSNADYLLLDIMVFPVQVTDEVHSDKFGITDQTLLLM